MFVLKDAVEAAVRDAHEAWTGRPIRPGTSSLLDRPLSPSPPPAPSRAGGQETLFVRETPPARKLISWTRIQEFAESAANIGPQVQEELERIGRSPAALHRSHRGQGRASIGHRSAA